MLVPIIFSVTRWPIPKHCLWGKYIASIKPFATSDLQQHAYSTKNQYLVTYFWCSLLSALEVLSGKQKLFVKAMSGFPGARRDILIWLHRMPRWRERVLSVLHPRLQIKHQTFQAKDISTHLIESSESQEYVLRKGRQNQLLFRNIAEGTIIVTCSCCKFPL